MASSDEQTLSSNGRRRILRWLRRFFDFLAILAAIASIAWLYFGSQYGSAPHGSAPDGSAPPESSAVISRRSSKGYWNPWLADIHKPRDAIGTLLRKDSQYVLQFDLSPYQYPQEFPVEPVEIDPSLADALDKYDARAPIVLAVLPVITGRSVKRLSTRELPREINIDLGRLRHPRDPQKLDESLEDFAERSRAGSIKIYLDAVESGCSTVSVSIWNEALNKPVDNIGVRLAVAEPDGSQPSCYAQEQAEVLYGKVGSLLDQEPGHRVDAALHIFEIGNEDIAVFKAQGGELKSWRLNQSILGRIDNPSR